MLSQRLRGKSLMAVCGTPLLGWVIHRIKQMEFIDEIIVATSDQTADDPIAFYSEGNNVKVVRGDNQDVLSRFTEASKDLSDVDVLLRFTADNPLYDPDRTRAAKTTFENSKAEYGHIDGLSHLLPEFIQVTTLRDAASNTSESYDREHVTAFIRNNPERYRVVTMPSDYCNLIPKHNKKFTIDRQDQLEDFEAMISEVAGDQNPVNVGVDQCYLWLNKINKNVPAQ